MRLKSEKLEQLCERIFAVLKADADCQFIRDEQLIREQIHQIFFGDLKREDEIEEDIRQKLEEHREQISRGQFSFQDLFQKAKKQTAREKHLTF